MADYFLTTDTSPGYVIVPPSPSLTTGAGSGGGGKRGDISRSELERIFSEDSPNALDNTAPAGIWWWCIVYNTTTHANLDFVYSTIDVMFDWIKCKTDITDFVNNYITGSQLSLRFLKEDYLGNLYSLWSDLAFDKITQAEFDEQAKTLLADNPFVNIDLQSGINPDTVYRLVSFRRILNPMIEYLPYKTEIDNLHKSQLTFDLIATDRAMNSDSSVRVNLQYARDLLERQIQTLTLYIDSLEDVAAIALVEATISNLRDQIDKINETLEKINNGRFD